METIRNQTYETERALYHLRGAVIENCIFAGKADGESPLKECRNVAVARCRFALRYPMWHDEGLSLSDSVLEEGCRAPLWYCKNATLQNVTVRGVKALRECDGVTMADCDFSSDEVFWNCRDVSVKDSTVAGVYPFFGCRNLTLENVTLSGKYSFQYVENLTLRHCELNTKDAFWHARNVVAEDCRITGEYLGWYSENVRLVHCRITGTQPLCYCKSLVMEDCTMDGCDFSFENSEVTADVRGTILSVKNPRSGTVTADGYGEVIIDGDTPYPVEGKVQTK